MTEPKEQAVPVVGVEEAVETVARIIAPSAFAAFDEPDFDSEPPIVQRRVIGWIGEAKIKASTILQALQGSSLRDTHRATEQRVVAWEDPETADRTHAPHLERQAYNQMPKTGERDLRLMRYDGTDLYQWFGKRGGSVFEDALGEPFLIRPEGRSDHVVEPNEMITAHRATEQPVVGWRPIESAPRDGTEFLAYRPDQGVFVCRFAWLGEFINDSDLTQYDDGYANWFHDLWGWLENDLTPTFWTALPAGPSDSGEAALGGDEAEGGVNQDLQAQLKAAYEALERIVPRLVEIGAGDLPDTNVWSLAKTAESIARKALARRGEG